MMLSRFSACKLSRAALMPKAPQIHGLAAVAAVSAHSTLTSASEAPASPSAVLVRHATSFAALNTGAPAIRRRNFSNAAAAGDSAAAALSTSNTSLWVRKRTRDLVLHTATLDLRVSILDNTRTVDKARRTHGLSRMHTELLGRALSGASLLASFMQGEERVIVEACGQLGPGPFKRVYAEAIHTGEARGLVRDLVETPESSGTFRVSSIMYNRRQPNISVVRLQDGDINSELQHYAAQSEQVPTAVVVDTRCDESGQVLFSGGLLIQSMPGAPEDLAQQLQYRLTHELPALSSMFLDQKMDLLQILGIVLAPSGQTFSLDAGGMGHTLVDFFCRCNHGGTMKAMMALPRDELLELRRELEPNPEQSKRTVQCEFCQQGFAFSAEQWDQMCDPPVEDQTK